MRFCKKCGTPYTKSLGVCPKCNAQQWLERSPEEAKTDLSEQELQAKRKRSWIGILIGVPALIGFLYGIYYIIKLLTPPAV